MRLYEGTVQQFKEDVINNRIADLLKIKFEESFLFNCQRKALVIEYCRWS